ncbi:MAG TPA: hypothetical protein VN367_03935, partial [Chlorobaculum sp.]|nr:hypothetical protein [Chlorobaculum sp.]
MINEPPDCMLIPPVCVFTPVIVRVLPNITSKPAEPLTTPDNVWFERLNLRPPVPLMTTELPYVPPPSSPMIFRIPELTVVLPVYNFVPLN